MADVFNLKDTHIFRIICNAMCLKESNVMLDSVV